MPKEYKLKPISRIPVKLDFPLPLLRRNIEQKKPDPITYVYFIRDDIHVKVGKATNVMNRFGGIQTGNPRELELLFFIPESIITEKQVHHLLKDMDLHHKREWFHFNERMESFIEVLKVVKKNVEKNWNLLDDVEDLLGIEREKR